jgi:DNA-binding Lrp family transcriptional regulator
VTSASAHQSDTLDLLDRQLVRALQLNPRAPFSLLGETLGVAEQTAARRLRRLRRDGLLRVTAGVEPHALGLTSWTVRVRCRPEATMAVADALARRDDVSWVSIYSAGWEVVFSLRARSDADAEDLLVRLLPKTAPVLDVSAAAVLHTFVGGNPADWRGWRDVLTEDQAALLRTEDRPAPRGPRTLTDTDHKMLELLTRDGRTGYATLARATGTSIGRVRRRLDTLTDAGAIYFDVDLAPAATGAFATSTLWLTVTPRCLAAVGDALAAHDDIPYAAALSGPANLSATVTAANLDSVYRFVTGTLAALDGITGYELAPQLRRVKQSGALVTDGRLATPVRRRR